MPRIAMIVIVAAMALLLSGWSGCSSNPVKPVVTKPEVVEVTKQVYVRIDPDLTKPVPDPAPGPMKTGEQLKNGYDDRGSALQQCNGKLSDIGSVQGTATPC